MPVSVTSFFVKANPVIPFILQDKDLRGGLRVVSDSSFLLPVSDNPGAIPMGARVPGMLVVTSDNMHVHQLESDGIFSDKGPLGAGSNEITNVAAPLYIDEDGNLSVESTYTLPQDGNHGDILRLDAERKPMWAPLDSNPDVGVRTVLSHSAPYAINPGTHYDFELLMGRTNLLIEVRIDVPQVMIEAFGDPSYGEMNPYTFKSRPGQLFDNGSTLLSDGTLRYTRRFSFVANTEDPVKETIYWRLTNQSNLPVQPTLTVIFTAIE